MADDCALHEYRIRFRADGGTGERQVRAVVDCQAQTITVELPDGTRATIDAVTARAVYMLLHEAVYSSLEPTGPLLRLERNTAHGWALGGAGR
ncbi:MAG: hypothetical protein GEU94_07365 [Micromonosporaceae bacterium]|nr:hypothetical protein [Micromonosporaceae bacterium]